MKKTQFCYSIYCVILLLLYSLLTGCQRAEITDLESNSQSSLQQIDSENSLVESSQEKDGIPKTESVQRDESQVEKIAVPVLEFEVKPGAHLTEILDDLVTAGWGDSVDALLIKLDQMDRSQYQLWNQIENPKERAFAAEGYIAPGVYEWEETATVDEVLEKLMSSWDEVLTDKMLNQANQQGYTVDEVLIMASIVEWESSFDPHNIVKPNVAAVVRNRIESGSALQMDVTVLYLQEALEPYRNPEQYESFYDTYIRSTLPAGPIGSPSIASIQAVLNPADTADQFFVYDEEGNYYFAKDYDQHLMNCDLAGIY